MRPNARRFETWENYVAGKIGHGTAVDYALNIGMDVIEKRVKDLAGNLRKRMSNMSGVAIQDLGQEKCGIISFSIKEMDPDLIVSQMSKWSINISTTSSVSTPYDMLQRNIQLMNRLGIHYYNTESESTISWNVFKRWASEGLTFRLSRQQKMILHSNHGSWIFWRKNPSNTKKCRSSEVV